MTDFTPSPETETLDAWVDALPDDNECWCGWHPVHGYGLHWGVKSSKSLIKLTEQNIKLGWEVRRVYLSAGLAQTPRDPLQEVYDAINALGGGPVQDNSYDQGIVDTVEKALEIIERMQGRTL